MTPMPSDKQIEVMPVGRELDLLIYAVVMQKNSNERETVDGWPVENIPSYSASIYFALEVQAEMHRRGYWMSLRSSFDKDGGKFYDGWFCGFTPHLTSGWNGAPDNSTQGDTAPLAICRAALKTVLETTRPNNTMQATFLRSASESA